VATQRVFSWSLSNNGLSHPKLTNDKISGTLGHGQDQHRRGLATLALLAGAGVPVLKALQTAAHTLSNTALRAHAMQLATILEPLLIVTMGVVVMLIVLAVMLPIIQLNQFVR
jgi:type II secretory pathway component PulF